MFQLFNACWYHLTIFKVIELMTIGTNPLVIFTSVAFVNGNISIGTDQFFSPVVGTY